MRIFIRQVAGVPSGARSGILPVLVPLRGRGVSKNGTEKRPKDFLAICLVDGRVV